MKKTILVLAVSSLGFISCGNNNSSDNKSISDSSLMEKPGSANPPAIPADSVENIDTGIIAPSAEDTAFH